MNLPFVLSLGSNVGDRLATLRRAHSMLAETDGIEVTAASSVYETAPWGKTDQPPFLNAVVVGETSLSPEELLAACQGIEDALGRVRTERWGPRTIDIDIIRMGLERRTTDELTLPHPLAAERAFVVVPWHEVDPVATEEMCPEVGSGDVTRLCPLVEAP